MGGPGSITYGTPLSDTQLNATVNGVAGGSAAGVLIYDPSVDAVLSASSHTLTVTAAATTDYTQATETSR